MDRIVEVSSGRVRGVRRSDVWSFSGIPYARPPIGPLRWRPPQPPEPWSEVRDAAEFGPIAPQAAGLPGVASPVDPGGAAAQDEDCLTLNIWTPEVPDNPAAQRGRPVMVWIHPGGFTGGSGSMAIYRGGTLVRRGDVVVVTINHRLGALGFLGHPALRDASGHLGSWGIHDQIAALRWVRDHIAIFGGDPGNVTLFGESAGGFSVATLMGTPAAAGLFHRAIVQSGGVHMHTEAEAARAADRLTEALGLTHCDRETLESVPAADLVGATQQIAALPPDPGLIRLPFLPVLDGALFPHHPLRAVADGASAEVDLVIGTNKDEVTVFGLGDRTLETIDLDGVARWVAVASPDVDTEALLDTYISVRTGRSEPVTPRDLWFATGTDGLFRWPSLQFAAAHHGRTFAYLFEWESPAFGGTLGACHALDVPFVFGSVRQPAVQLFTGSGPEVDALSALMQDAWLAFARTGDPSHPALGSWSTWDPDRRSTMVFGLDTGQQEAPRNEELAAWERFLPLPVRAGAPAASQPA